MMRGKGERREREKEMQRGRERQRKRLKIGLQVARAHVDAKKYEKVERKRKRKEGKKSCLCRGSQASGYHFNLPGNQVCSAIRGKDFSRFTDFRTAESLLRDGGTNNFIVT